MKIFSVLNTLLNRVTLTMKTLGNLLIIFIVLAVIIEVLSLYVLGTSQNWVLELSEYALVFITFLGATWLLSEDGHIRFDLVIRSLKPKTQQFLEIINSVIGSILFAIISYYSFLTTLNLYERGVRTESLLALPRAVLLSIIPLCTFFMLIIFIKRLFQSLKNYTQH